ncbi:MAG: DNA polymerase III subunit gamma/tau [Bacilli bacterium]|nr:DNA polymerase III subunit gamma/tau [Bacilli bacterium]
MSYKVLYRKYRPSDFDNVVGQKYTIDMLRNAITSGKHSHAYIFTGPRGTGKTSCAKIFAKALNCEHPVNGNPCGECISCSSFLDSPDIIELDAASNNGVDQVRDLIDSVRLVPSSLNYKVYIIDEVHMLSTSAFNALLLTLEEPPEHVIFILATTDIQKVPITILSRCQRFDFKPISSSDIIDRLKYICSLESISASDDALTEIANLSAGGMRDALGMLDQLSNDNAEITLDLVNSYFGSISSKKIDSLINAIFSNDSDTLISIFDDIKSSGVNYSVLVEKLVNALRDYAIGIKTGKYDSDFDIVINLIFDLNESLSNVSNVKIDPFVLIEVIILKYVNLKPALGNNLGNNLALNSPISNGIVNDVKSNIVDNTKSISKQGETKPEVVSSEFVEEPVINTFKINFDINLRISNCFSEADKAKKEELIPLWNDFVSGLKLSDKKIFGLLSDTVIQAASGRYAIISSKIDSTNDLINENILNIENLFTTFSSLNYRFVAVSNDLWKEEVKKYRENVKNKIKYIYVEENVESKKESKSKSKASKSDIEDLGDDVFGSMLEVE